MHVCIKPKCYQENVRKFYLVIELLWSGFGIRRFQRPPSTIIFLQLQSASPAWAISLTFVFSLSSSQSSASSPPLDYKAIQTSSKQLIQLPSLPCGLIYPSKKILDLSYFLIWMITKLVDNNIRIVKSIYYWWISLGMANGSRGTCPCSKVGTITFW